MSAAQPIRSYEDVQRFKNYYLKKGEYRNYLLVTICLNTALRISDVLSLKWRDIINPKTKDFKEHISIKEGKTGKYANISINASIKEAVNIYFKYSEIKSEYIFVNKNNEPLSRISAFNIIKSGGEGANLDRPVSCHSLRKTFGYHAWKKGVPPVILMNIYNHSGFEITKRYLGIEQDDKDNVFNSIEL